MRQKLAHYLNAIANAFLDNEKQRAIKAAEKDYLKCIKEAIAAAKEGQKVLIIDLSSYVDPAYVGTLKDKFEEEGFQVHVTYYYGSRTMFVRWDFD